MNISFDAKRYFHNNRGLGNYSRDVIRLLASYYPENNYYLFNPVRNENSYPVYENTQVVYPDSFFYKKFSGLWRSKGCVKQIEYLHTDIFHGLSQELPFGIHKTKIKTVVTLHDAIFMRYPELYDRLYRKIFIQKNKYSVQAADSIIAISEQTKQDFITFFDADPNKIRIVYQGCNPIFRQNVTNEQRKEVREKYQLPEGFLLNVGAIEKRKNIELIIRALSVEKIDLPLVVIGNKTAYYDEMKLLIKSLGIEKQVYFYHNVPTKDLPVILSMASVFIYPSVFEGFGIPILEALCTRTPVITSHGSCFKETGGDAAWYVSSDNPEEMAVAIQTICSDRQLRQQMIEKGQMHAANFSDDIIAENLMQVYIDTCKK